MRDKSAPEAPGLLETILFTHKANKWLHDIETYTN